MALASPFRFYHLRYWYRTHHLHAQNPELCGDQASLAVGMRGHRITWCGVFGSFSPTASNHSRRGPGAAYFMSCLIIVHIQPRLWNIVSLITAVLSQREHHLKMRIRWREKEGKEIPTGSKALPAAGVPYLSNYNDCVQAHLDETGYQKGYASVQGKEKVQGQENKKENHNMQIAC